MRIIKYFRLSHTSIQFIYPDILISRLCKKTLIADDRRYERKIMGRSRSEETTARGVS